MQIEDFSEELLGTSREAIELSKEYRAARSEYGSAFNRLTVLMEKNGLASDKGSFDNKIIKLLSIKPEASEIHHRLISSQELYKGLEIVIKSYHAHCSSLQSCIKFQTTGEMHDAMKRKYK